METTRDRLIAAALRLFAERGYAGTSVSEIEDAAGLSGGSGSLYRHFSSKRELLAAGIRSQLEGGPRLEDLLSSPALAAMPLRERLIAVARAGLRRLEHERDLNLLIVRDLARFPDLLDLVRVDEVRRVHGATAAWLAAQFPVRPDTDRAAVAAVLIGSTSHFWLRRDVFGTHPADVEEDAYLGALVDALVPHDPPSKESA